MHQISPPPIEVRLPLQDILALPDIHSMRPPPLSALPPPGNLHICISLTDKPGCGRPGLVYRVKVSPDVGLPALAVKIARIGYHISLVQEASVYSEMESVQGIAVPLCYGLFEGHLSNSRQLDVDQDKMQYKEDCKDVAEVEEYSPDKNRRINLETRRRDAADPSWVCILILELLGKLELPVGVDISKAIRYVSFTIFSGRCSDSHHSKDLHGLYQDLIDLYLVHRDIHHPSIRSAGQASIPSCP